MGPSARSRAIDASVEEPTLERDHADGPTPLIDAVRRGDVDALEALIESGSDVDARDGRGRCALYYAATGSDYAITRMLLQAGASRDLLYESELDPLHVAFRDKNYALVRLLLTLKPHLRTPCVFDCLEIALLYGWRDVLQTMMERGADVATRDASGCGLIRVIVSHPSDEITDEYRTKTLLYLMSRGAAVNLTRNDALNSVKLLAANADVETLRSVEVHHLGLSYWASLSRERYLEVLYRALKNRRHRRVFKYIFERRYPEAAVRSEAELVRAAIDADNCSALKYLLKLPETDVECESEEDGLTPMRFAVERNRFECIRLLLSHGADVNGKNGRDAALPLRLALRRNLAARRSAQHLVRRIAVLEASEKFVDRRHYEDMDSLGGSLSRLRQYHEDCRAEIELMRESLVHGRLAVFDILMRESERIRDRGIVEALANESIVDSFPLYRDALRVKFRRIRKRSPLVVRAEPILMRILKCDSNRTFSLVAEKIFGHLRIKDLRNFALTFADDDPVDDQRNRTST